MDGTSGGHLVQPSAQSTSDRSGSSGLNPVEFWIPLNGNPTPSLQSYYRVSLQQKDLGDLESSMFETTFSEREQIVIFNITVNKSPNKWQLSTQKKKLHWHYMGLLDVVLRNNGKFASKCNTHPLPSHTTTGCKWLRKALI